MRLVGLCLVLLLVAVRPGTADVACDGVDDRLSTTAQMNAMLSGPIGTMMLWYRPTGTPGSVSAVCTGGDFLMGDDLNTSGAFGYQWLVRNSNFGGVGDRLCGMNDDGTGATEVATPYTVNVWTHLAWRHTGGTLFLYKDGVEVGSVASGDTNVLTPQHLSVCGAGFGEYQSYAEGVVTGVQIFPTAVSPQVIRAQVDARMHYFGNTTRSGAWTLDSCSTTGNAHAFFDSSGNSRTLTGDDGAGNTGLTCLGNTVLVYPWGAE